MRIAVQYKPQTFYATMFWYKDGKVKGIVKGEWGSWYDRLSALLLDGLTHAEAVARMNLPTWIDASLTGSMMTIDTSCPHPAMITGKSQCAGCGKEF